MSTRTFLPALTALALVLAGCGSTAEEVPVAADPAAVSAADAVAVEDAWVKAASSGRTGAFGELRNTGDADVTVVLVATPASPMVELHETVEDESGAMVMREKDGGFTIPAGGTLTLEPGANHLMLMALAAPVLAGDEVTFTLHFSDDSTLDFTAPAKDFAGGDEPYHDDDAGEDADMGTE